MHITDNQHGEYMAKKVTKNIGGEIPTNDAKDSIELGFPYTAKITLEGSSDLLFHRWSCEDVAEKSALKKGSKGKKTDNIESYVYRNDKGEICIPGEYLRQSILQAAKFRQDPRSPRKSAMDLFKAGIITLTNLASVGKDEWDYLDVRRVCIQRAGISRTRPALKTGWRAEFLLMVNTPEYISPADLNEVIQMAGRLIGLADFRPTFGRFNVVGFEVLN